MSVRDRHAIVDDDGRTLGWAGEMFGTWTVGCDACDWVATPAPGGELAALQAHRSEMVRRHS